MMKLAIVTSLLFATPALACPGMDHDNAPKTADKKADAPKTDKAKEQPKTPDAKQAPDTAKKEAPAPKKKA